MPLEVHVWELFLATWIAVGPVPIALATVQADSEAEDLGLAHRWLVMLTVWCGVAAAVAIGLGMAHGLRLPWLVVTMSVLFVVGVVLLRSRRGSNPCGQLLPTAPLPLTDAVVGGAIASLAFGLLLRVLTRPITDHDSVAYHLPTIAQWVQTGWLARMAQFELLVGLYPYSWEAVCALLVLPFHEDCMVALPNLIAWIVLGLGIYRLSMELGAHRTAAMAAAALALSMPSVLSNVNTLAVDLPVSAFFTVGLYFVVRWVRGRSRSSLGLLLVALGLTAGVKTSGLIYGILIGVTLSVCLLFGVGRERRQVRRGARWVLALGTVCAVLVGGYWYGRNFVECRNPVGGVAITLGQHVVFPGEMTTQYVRRTTLLALFDTRNLIDWQILVSEMSEHLAWPWYALAALAALAVVTPWLTRRPARNRHWVGMLLLVCVTACLYAATPFSGGYARVHWQITPWIGQALRYALPCCAMLAVLAALGATAAGLPRGLLLALAAGAAVWGLGTLKLTVALIFVPASIAGLRLLEKPSRETEGAWRGNRLQAASLAILVCLPSLVVGSYLARLWRDHEQVRCFGEIVRVLPSLVKPKETIGYVASTASYLLYGRDLSRKVVYLPLRPGDREGWRSYLRTHHVAAVAAGPVRPVGPARDLVRWLDSAQGPLVRVFGDPGNGLALYRLKDDRDSSR